MRVLLRRIGSGREEVAADLSQSSPERRRVASLHPSFSLLLKREEMLSDLEFLRTKVMLLDIDVRRFDPPLPTPMARDFSLNLRE